MNISSILNCTKRTLMLNIIHKEQIIYHCDKNVIQPLAFLLKFMKYSSLGSVLYHNYHLLIKSEEKYLL